MVTHAPNVPAQVGQFRIVRKLGRGASADVFLARDARLGRKVAIKIARADFTDGARSARFTSEARLMAKRSHPNIVSVYDVGVHDGRPYVVFEIVQGRTLKEILADAQSRSWGPISLRYAVGIAEALNAAHRAGIVHRDLKPANILIGADGRLRVTDFGMAMSVATSEDVPVDPGMLKQDEADETLETAEPGVDLVGGTPRYMAPEQWSAQNTPAVDIWALGLVLHELATGQHPMSRSFTVPQIMALVRSPEPLPLSSRR